MVDPVVGLSGPPEELPWVVDTGPLSHFAKAGWLGLFKVVAGNRRVIVPDSVYAEVVEGALRHQHLNMVIDATKSWLTIVPVEDINELAAFARFAGALVGADGRRNLGECGVLALAETMPAIAIIDDRAARQQASGAAIEHRGSVALIVEAVQSHGLSREIAGAVADDLLASEYRLPFEPGLFVRWCVENGQLDYE